MNKQLSSSPALQPAGLLMILVCATGGCERANRLASVHLEGGEKAAQGSSADQVGATQYGATQGDTVQAGVILADRAGYLCLPFERLGFDEDAEIVSLQSSCECVQPSLVGYLDVDGLERPAMLLLFVPEPGASEGDRAGAGAARLGVSIEATLASGQTRSFRVDLLHTMAVPWEAA
jgi:hypothetical protein